MKKFKLEQIVYIITGEDEWDITDPIDLNLKVMRGEISGIYEERRLGGALYRHYEVSTEDYSDIQVSPYHIFRTKKEAEKALAAIKDDREKQKIAVYELLRDQLDELGV